MWASSYIHMNPVKDKLVKIPKTINGLAIMIMLLIEIYQ